MKMTMYSIEHKPILTFEGKKDEIIAVHQYLMEIGKNDGKLDDLSMAFLNSMIANHDKAD